MNAARRKELDRAAVMIGQAANLLSEARDLIEYQQSEEQEAFDNMPESLQDGERGQKAQEAIEHMNTAIDGLDNIDFEEISDALAAAAE